MSTVSRNPKNGDANGHGSKASRIPELATDGPDSPERLAREIAGRTAAAYHEAERHYREAYQRFNLTHPPGPERPDSEHGLEARWERWCGLTQNNKDRARYELIRLVLALNGRVDPEATPEDLAALGTRWEPCSARIDGRLYVVSQQDHREDDEEFAPVLAVLNPSAAQGADTPAAAEAPAEVKAEIAPHQPLRPRRASRHFDHPMIRKIAYPMLRDLGDALLTVKGCRRDTKKALEDAEGAELAVLDSLADAALVAETFISNVIARTLTLAWQKSTTFRVTNDGLSTPPWKPCGAVVDFLIIRCTPGTLAGDVDFDADEAVVTVVHDEDFATDEEEDEYLRSGPRRMVKLSISKAEVLTRDVLDAGLDEVDEVA